MGSISVSRVRGSHLWKIAPDYGSPKLKDACRSVPGMVWVPDDDYGHGEGFVDAIDHLIGYLLSKGIRVRRGDLPEEPSNSHRLLVASKGLREYQKVGVDFCIANAPEGCILADDMGCISGEARVGIRPIGSNNYRHIHVSELKRRWDRGDYKDGLHVHGVIEGMFGDVLIKNVLYSGAQAVYSLKGKYWGALTLTGDHEVLTERGFVRTDALAVDTDRIALFSGQKDDRIRWSPIESLVPAGKIDTFDIACEEPHNFVANGIVVHNCGKTFQALVVAHAFKTRTVIVCLSYVKSTWSKEIVKRFPKARYQVLEGVKDARAIDPQTELVIVNYDILYAWLPWLVQWKARGLIIDEMHLISNLRSRRTLSVLGIRKISSWCLGLSGTPMTNRPASLYGALSVICPGRFGDEPFVYQRVFCDGHYEEIEVRME